MLKIVKITYVDIYICIFALTNKNINKMKNTFTFLVAFTLITLFSSFQEQPDELWELSTVPAKIMISENAEPIAVIDKYIIDSVQMLTDIDLQGLQVEKIREESDLKKQLISLIGSLLTMIVMFFLRRFFPNAMKFEKSKKNIN